MAFTYFFRDVHTLNLVVQHLLPQVAGRSRVKVWDAGCAMGQEPYSLAILLAEGMGKFAFRNVHIDATDLDGSCLFGDIIAGGEYPAEELQRIPEDKLQRHFAPSGRSGYLRLNEEIRSRVTFRRHDLLTLQPPGAEYSLVICKNVLLHFSAQERVSVLQMFHRSLVPGGLLALEQTQKLPQAVAELFVAVTAEAQVFQKRGEPG
ncbi:MAG TPA: CheR family methyltransferase [Patescibacteria group bacterium]|nr:CheR family methyltransferase [Patescibacteria group bacterium]